MVLIGAENILLSYKGLLISGLSLRLRYRSLPIISFLLSAADRQCVTLLVPLDLSAACATVVDHDHVVDLRRLQNQNGFDGTALQWLKQFLHAIRSLPAIFDPTLPPTGLRCATGGGGLRPTACVSALHGGDVCNHRQLWTNSRWLMILRWILCS